MNLTERHKILFRRGCVAFSLVAGLYSAFFTARTWSEVHWIGWFLAAAWSLSFAFPILDRLRSRGGTPTLLLFGARSLAEIAAQNSAQEVLFFVLPFWIRSTTFSSCNASFTIVLLAMAAATLYDPFYLGAIVAHPRRHAVFRSLLLFAGLDFLLPVLTSRSTVECAILAGAWSGASAGLGLARRPARGILWGGIAGLFAAWALQGGIAPVPLHVDHPILCSGIRDHDPKDTLATVPPGDEAWFWTPVFGPPGRTDSVIHVWSRDGDVVARIVLPLHGGRERGFRTWSSSRKVASSPGRARVEVRLKDGQLLGRQDFEVGSAPP